MIDDGNETDEERSIIPRKDVVKRMAIVDGCNVLHLCAGMGLDSYAEQEMLEERKPDAIGLLLVVKKLMEEDFDVRVFLSMSYMSQHKEFKSLGILTVVPPYVHDDKAILEYATQVGGFIVSNDKFREFKYYPKMSKCTKCVERTIRFKFKQQKNKLNFNEKNNDKRNYEHFSKSLCCSLPTNKIIKNDLDRFQLGMELQMELDSDLCTSNISSDIDFLFVHSYRIQRSKSLKIQTLCLIQIMLDFIQLEFSFIRGLKPQPVDYFKGHKPPSKFSNFLKHFNKHKNLRHQQQDNIFII